MPTPSANYTASGTDFDLIDNENDAIDPTEQVKKLSAALEEHTHAATRGLAVTRLGDVAALTGFSTAPLPTTSDGAALGSTTKMWSDLFLASGAVINFNNGNITLTHSAGALALAGGYLTIAAQPGFLAYNSVQDDNVTGAGTVATVDFDTEVYDQAGNFSGDTFTAPVTGRYLLATTVALAGLTSSMTSVTLYIVTSNRTYQVERMLAYPAGGDRTTVEVTAVVDMDAADTAYVQVMVSNGAGNTADVRGLDGGRLTTFFSGHLVA